MMYKATFSWDMSHCNLSVPLLLQFQELVSRCHFSSLCPFYSYQLEICNVCKSDHSLTKQNGSQNMNKRKNCLCGIQQFNTNHQVYGMVLGLRCPAQPGGCPKQGRWRVEVGLGQWDLQFEHESASHTWSLSCSPGITVARVQKVLREACRPTF